MKSINDFKVWDVTKTRASGRPANAHVVRAHRKIQPNYEELSRLFSQAGVQTAGNAD